MPWEKLLARNTQGNRLGKIDDGIFNATPSNAVCRQDRAARGDRGMFSIFPAAVGLMVNNRLALALRLKAVQEQPEDILPLSCDVLR